MVFENELVKISEAPACRERILRGSQARVGVLPIRTSYQPKLCKYVA